MRPDGEGPDSEGPDEVAPPTVLDPGRRAVDGENPAPPTILDPGRAPVGGQPPTVLDPGRAPVGGQPPTTLDPGRAPVGGQPPTALDPGRAPVGGQPVTTLDPGRTRPDRGINWFQSLPPRLGARLRVIRELTESGQEASLILVQERATGVERVLKVYRRDWTPDARVWDYLTLRRASRHVAEVLETGTEDGRYYEIAEYIAGGTLLGLRQRSPAGLERGMLIEMVRQIADGLADMHANGIVHRDLKPANILVRSLDPFDLAIVDFGISMYVGEDDSTNTDSRAGTAPYTPVEYLAVGLVSPAFDWWSLGIGVVELFLGQPLFPGLDDLGMRTRIASAPLSTSGVGDERIRLLCRGLLAQSHFERWGLEQVREWLDGGSPRVAAVGRPTEPAEPTEASAAEPFTYNEWAYRRRDQLAAAMTATWETAASVFYGADPEPLRQLDTWMRQFRRVPRARDRSRRVPIDVRLLRRLRSIDPAHPPVYRHENIAVDRLPELARRALDDVGNAPDIVRELWTYELLPLLAQGTAASGLSGGTGLVEAGERWALERRRWERVASAVTDEDVRAEVERLREQEQPRLLALWLLAATATEPDRSQVRRDLVERQYEYGLPWFGALLADPDGLWVAFTLGPFAAGAAQRRADQERQERLEQEWLRRTRYLRAWSRRQNRPQAVAHAVSGVFALGVLCAFLTGIGDAADIASDAAVLDGWLAVVLGAGLALTAESLLAWEIGGTYHPRYSLLGGSIIRLGRFGRRIAGRRVALWWLLGTLAILIGLTVLAPALTPAVVALLVLVWAVMRHLRWRDDVEAEEAAMDAPDREEE